MSKKTRTLSLKSASAIKFTRGEIAGFASQVVERTQPFFSRQDPYIVPDRIDVKVQTRLQKAILRSYRAKGVRGATFGNAATADGLAVILTLKLAPSNCGKCGEAYRRLTSGFSYIARGVDVTGRITDVLHNHGVTKAHQFACPKCGSPDNKPVEGHAMARTSDSTGSNGALPADLSLLDRITEF
jgi:hypothetical protein